MSRHWINERGGNINASRDPIAQAPAAGTSLVHLVPFTGERSGNYPLTWSQKWLWRAFSLTAPNTQRMNMKRLVRVPKGTSMDQVTRAVSILISRHEALRTRFYVSESGEPRQAVAEHGDIKVTEHRVSDAATSSYAHEVLEEIGAAPFTAPEISVRIAVTTNSQEAQFIALCVLHLATDALGMEILLKDLRSILNAVIADQDTVSSPEQLSHPSVRVAYEHSPKGLERSIRSINYWKGQVSLFGPASRLAPSQPGEWPLFREVHMRSTALSAASHALEKHLRVSPASVFTGLAALLLCAKKRSSGTGFLVFSHNRYSRKWSAMSGPLTQSFPILVEVADRSLPDVFRAIDHLNMTGGFYGQYDPDQLTEALDQVAASRGFAPDMSCAINVVAGQGSGIPAASRAPKSSREMELLMEDTEFSEGAGLQHEDMNFFLTVAYHPTETKAFLRANTRIFSIADISDFLRSMEKVGIRLVAELTEEDHS
ncbi:condensation domain-containing protein [Streptomyces pseudovenezuelae]|uniref:condensation domain-containing protein n=1 Tax=Streptomyces pseudovenezuelae TaxID=67350 RepID=UPI0037124CE4